MKMHFVLIHAAAWRCEYHRITTRVVCPASSPSSLPSLSRLESGRAHVLQLLVPYVWPASPLSPFRPCRCRRHADSDTNVQSGRAVRQPRPAAGPGGTHFALLVHYFSTQVYSS